MTPRFTHVVGARPNFMKAAPIAREFSRRGWRQTLIHTGQHYDELMSAVLFAQLQLPVPDINLGVGSGTHAQQTANVMLALEPVLIDEPPSLLVVYGDVNSTVAAAITAAKLGIPVAHVEAGVRSRDRSMPEELNRLVTDRLSTFLLAPSETAAKNLSDEGVAAASIFNVGNVMVDALMRALPMADADAVLHRLGIDADRGFALVTLHRASNVDDPETLSGIVRALNQIAADLPVVFPVHPRTRGRLPAVEIHTNLHLIQPAGYLEFVGLQRAARLVITDSGGVQVESTFLRTPCLTFRENTEWPETIEVGNNTLIGRNPDRLVEVCRAQLKHGPRCRDTPSGWDGNAAHRIADVLERIL